MRLAINSLVGFQHMFRCLDIQSSSSHIFAAMAVERNVLLSNGISHENVWHTILVRSKTPGAQA